MYVLPGTRRLKWAAALAVIAATMGIGDVDARSAARAEMNMSQAAGVGDSLTADVSIGQTHVAADGQSLPGAAPAARYRLEHRAGSLGATTTLTLLELQRDTAEGVAGRVALDNPLVAVRMELDPTGGLRLFNRRGGRLREPTAADRRLFGVNPGSGSAAPDSRAESARGRAASLVVAANRSPERRAELERVFGAPVERVRGLDRYVASRNDTVHEVLVDPATVLPTELNTVRAGRLVSRVQIAYEDRGNGTLVRRSFRAERALPDTARRVVTTIDVTNVKVVIGGGQ